MNHSVDSPATTASAKTTMKIPALLEHPPAIDHNEDQRRLEICRRELRSWAEHLQRCHRIHVAHYDQLAWLRVQLNDLQAALREEEARLIARRTEVERLEQDLQKRLQEAADQETRDRERLAADRTELQQERQRQEEDLRKETEDLRQEKERLASDWAALDRQRQQQEESLRQERDRWKSEMAEVEKALAEEAKQVAHQRQELVQSEAALQRRREELSQSIDELKQREHDTQQRGQAETSTLQRELATLKQQLDSATRKLADETRKYQEREKELRRELAALRQQLESGQARPAPPVPPSPPRMPPPEAEEPAVEAEWQPSGMGGMPGEVHLPAADVESYPEEVEEEAAAHDEDFSSIDLDNCEMILNAYREQLRADHQEIEHELRQAQGGAVRAATNHAPLARELAQLTRLREDIRLAIDQLNQERPAIKRASPTLHQRPPLEPKSKKTRGTFLGLRRWLGGSSEE